MLNKGLVVALVAVLLGVSAKADMIVTKDSSSPVGSLVLRGSPIALEVLRLSADSTEALDVSEISLGCYNGAVVGYFSFYNGSTLLGTAVGGESPKLVLSNGSLTILANTYARVTVKASLLPVDININDNGTCIWAGVTEDDGVKATSLATGNLVTSGIQRAIGNKMTIVKAKPAVSLAVNSPSGTLFPSFNQQLAIFDMACQGEGDVTFSDGQANQLVVNISRFQAHSDGIAGTWVLKDDTGTTLSAVSVQDDAESVVFSFEANDFVVAPGTSRKLYVYGDTHEYTHQFDAIQAWLDDSNYYGLSYSVNYGPTLPCGDLVFRGDYYGGVFVNTIPEPASASLLLIGGLLALRRKK